MSVPKPTRYPWFFLLAACAIGPFVFVLVQGYVARLLGPALSTLAISSSTELRIVMVSMNVVGSIIAAALVCFPLGWVVRKRAALLGAIVGLVGCAAISWTWLSVSTDNTVVSSLRILELAAYVAACIVLSVFGATGARRVAA